MQGIDVLPDDAKEEARLSDSAAARRPSFCTRYMAPLTGLCALAGYLLGTQLQGRAGLVEVLALPGTLFVRLLKCVVLPLMFCSMVTVPTKLHEAGARLAGCMALFYGGTTLLAGAEALCWWLVWQGAYSAVAVPATDAPPPEGRWTGEGHLVAFFVRAVPDNLVEAMASGNLMGVLTFGLISGVALTKVPFAIEQGQLTFLTFHLRTFRFSFSRQCKALLGNNAVMKALA